ncbi:MAG: DinB family protein [Nitrospira sp.]|nr:DinB family protein [Candidatus Brocadiales bacterium]MBL7048435.1 DinB family protein [Nitrospira sp.]
MKLTGQPITTIREQLTALLQGGNAHMGFEDAVKSFPTDFVNKKPPHIPYSFWHLLEHIRIAQWDILEFIRDPEHVTPEWPVNFWPPQDKIADEAMWNETLRIIRSDLKSFEDLVNDPETEFFSPIPHALKYNIFRQILLVADHNAYHISELITLRQTMGIPVPGGW